jgi:PRTRC genetic system protein E
MFQELMPLLSQRVLILTLSRVTDEVICVNVIPKPLKSDQQNNDTALSSPLAVSGTPKELDERLPKQLAEFVEAHRELSSTLKSAKEQMDAAANAARESARKSTNSKSHSGSNRSTTTSSAQVKIATDAQGDSDDFRASPEGTQAIPTGTSTAGVAASTGSLFDIEMKDDR